MLFEKISIYFNNITTLLNQERTYRKKDIIKYFCIIAVFFFVYGALDNAIVTSKSLNEYFSIKYQNEIAPQSEMEIDKIVAEVNSIPNHTDKLNRIAEWETSNFTDPFWENYLRNPVDLKCINPLWCSYKTNGVGKIKAMPFSPYNNDPYWVQYYNLVHVAKRPTYLRM